MSAVGRHVFFLILYLITLSLLADNNRRDLMEIIVHEGKQDVGAEWRHDVRPSVHACQVSQALIVN